MSSTKANKAFFIARLNFHVDIDPCTINFLKAPSVWVENGTIYGSKKDKAPLKRGLTKVQIVLLGLEMPADTM